MAEKIFQCQQCGHCCEGRGGIVLSQNDLNHIADYLQIPISTVIKKYVEYSGDKLKVRTKNNICIFFKKDIGCIVHDKKPAVCKAWPFFKGNIEDPISLDMAKTFCPGIKSDISHKDFSKYGLSYLKKNKLIAKDKEKEANTLIVK